ncbi:C39 family peptidase [Apilactobacillus apisilvae]|uniref:C39 family peptidase n=1 Tax=Apilactobacillus apisilvae TaxID=2923364 RepID=A0ABY4PH42_9LACO|nr:C39 family peptidase [Apilactobacillus apisilvae]UQS85130.1 C39 family peptidase [Apilactobacillus apisilvae]
MKSNTIASERINPFYVRLKHLKIEKWYVNEMQDTKSNRCSFSKENNYTKLEIDKIGFYKKQLWYHFCSSVEEGWVAHKFVRKNYRLLKLHFNVDHRYENAVIAAQALLSYSGYDLSLNEVIKFTKDKYSYKPNDFFKLFINNKGSFKLLTNKSYRRVRSQLLRNRPVLMWLDDNKHCVIIIGFNRRVFFYKDAYDGLNKTITISQLTRRWKKSGYLAFSY